jgi:hypothetical protein
LGEDGIRGGKFAGPVEFEEFGEEGEDKCERDLAAILVSYVNIHVRVWVRTKSSSRDINSTRNTFFLKLGATGVSVDAILQGLKYGNLL